MRRATVTAIAAGAAALVAVGVGAVWWMSSLPPAPEEAAQSYVTALAEGDVGALAALGAFDGGGQTRRDAFEGASGFVDEVRLESDGAGAATSHGFRARVELDGETREIDFVLALRDGRWRLAAEHLGTLRVASTLGDAVQVGDALVPPGELALLPAVYPVRAAPAELLDGESRVAVAGDRPTEVRIDAHLSPDAMPLAQAQFDAYLDECTAGGAELPSHCGIVVPWGADLASATRFAYRIEARPQLSLDPASGGFTATGGDVVVTVSGTTREGAPASVTYRDADWMLRGGMVFTRGELRLEVW